MGVALSPFSQIHDGDYRALGLAMLLDYAAIDESTEPRRGVRQKCVIYGHRAGDQRIVSDCVRIGVVVAGKV